MARRFREVELDDPQTNAMQVATLESIEEIGEDLASPFPSELSSVETDVESNRHNVYFPEGATLTIGLSPDAADGEAGVVTNGSTAAAGGTVVLQASGGDTMNAVTNGSKTIAAEQTVMLFRFVGGWVTVGP